MDSIVDSTTVTGTAAPTAASGATIAPAPAAAAREERLALGRGLFGLRRPAGERAWRLFWLEFPSKPASVSLASVR